MKLFFALMLLPALAFGIEDEGRYRFVNTTSHDFIIDTKTGKIWQLKDWVDRNQFVFVPVAFASMDNQSFSMTPEGSYNLKAREKQDITAETPSLLRKPQPHLKPIPR